MSFLIFNFYNVTAKQIFRLRKIFISEKFVNLEKSISLEEFANLEKSVNSEKLVIPAKAGIQPNLNKIFGGIEN